MLPAYPARFALAVAVEGAHLIEITERRAQVGDRTGYPDRRLPMVPRATSLASFPFAG
jgi:hypothetical protein